MSTLKTLARLCIGLTLAVGPLAHAAYPEKPITLVVPFPSGGGTAATARLIAGAISPLLGQNTVVENRAGAAGSLGAQARSAERRVGEEWDSSSKSGCWP